MKISHNEQRKHWDEEHRTPRSLLPMHSDHPSSGIQKLWEYMRAHVIHLQRGIEMGCGKGRNTLWLEQQGMMMVGFDFSEVAIREAKKRSQGKAEFLVHDATTPWPWKDASFDLAIDCFASTDIENESGRIFARQETERILKPGGYLLVYVMSNQSPFHQNMTMTSPAHEEGSFLNAQGKFEKTFGLEELQELYKNYSIVEKCITNGNLLIDKKNEPVENIWLLLKKQS